MPYSKYNDTVTLSKIQAGEIPQRPSEGIDGAVWEFLESCWSRDPGIRPSSEQVYDSIAQFRSLPQAVLVADGRSGMEELPGKLRLQVQSIKISLNKLKQQHLCVKFKYGNKNHTTAPTTKALGASEEHIWFAFRLLLFSFPFQTSHRSNPENWFIETNKQYHGQLVSFEVILRTSIFKKDRVCATGYFSVSP